MYDLLAPETVGFLSDQFVFAQTGTFFSAFIDNNTFVRSVIQAAGVILMFAVLVKFVWDKRKGQGGGQGGGLTQIAMGLLAAAAVFVPTFLGTIVDTGINGATGALDTVSDIFDDDGVATDEIGDPSGGDSGSGSGD